MVDTMEYKEIIKDEKSLIQYLDELVERNDLDTKNKIYSACLAGRMFEFEKLVGNNSRIVELMKMEMGS